MELIPNAGYTFASRTDFYDTYGRINGGLNLGGSVKFNLNRSFGIELLYDHINTRSGIYGYGDGTKLAGADLTLDYIMIGGVQSFNIPNSTVRPFIGAFLGAAVFTPGAEPDSYSDTKFAMGFQHLPVRAECGPYNRPGKGPSGAGLSPGLQAPSPPAPVPVLLLITRNLIPFPLI